MAKGTGFGGLVTWKFDEKVKTTRNDKKYVAGKARIQATVTDALGNVTQLDAEEKVFASSDFETGEFKVPESAFRKGVTMRGYFSKVEKDDKGTTFFFSPDEVAGGGEPPAGYTPAPASGGGEAQAPQANERRQVMSAATRLEQWKGWYDAVFAHTDNEAAACASATAFCISLERGDVAPFPVADKEAAAIADAMGGRVVNDPEDGDIPF